MSGYDVDVLWLQPGETRKLDFEFARELARGVTIASASGVTVTLKSGSGAVTASGTVASGTRVQATFAATTAADGSTFLAETTATTSSGDVLKGEGLIFVRNR